MCTPSSVCASQSSHSGGPRAGDMCGGSESTPMCSRIRLICTPSPVAAGSVCTTTCLAGAASAVGMRPLYAIDPWQTAGGRSTSAAAPGRRGRVPQYTHRHRPKTRCAGSPACLWRRNSPADPGPRRRAGCDCARWPVPGPRWSHR